MNTPSETKLLYLDDSYLTSCEATVLSLEPQPDMQMEVKLDQTIFAPLSVLHSADSGWIIGKKGKIRITNVFPSVTLPIHLGELEGYMGTGEPVTLKLEWAPRYQRMQTHTAGLLLTFGFAAAGNRATLIAHTKLQENRWRAVFYTMDPKKGHDTLQHQVNELISKKLPILTEPRAPFGQRKSSISNFPAVPDHETPLRNSGDCWPIFVEKIDAEETQIIVEYSRKKPTEKQPIMSQPAKFPSAVEAVRQQFYVDVNTQSAESLRQTYFGKKGMFTELALQLRDLTKEEKQVAGKLLNELKQELQTAIDNLTIVASKTGKPTIDFSLPGEQPQVGHVHPVSQAMNEITRIFQKIGFMRARYPEVDWEWYPFDALNMPKDHPARDDWETFLVADQYYHPQLGKMVLTPHTSNSQVREMQRLGSKPPIRMINIARCYRRQSDVTHTEMFHQFEGLVIDKGITIQHLKGVIDHFAREFYGPGAKSRIRPFHFQFTEPSFEVDFSCMICNGTGIIRGERCRFCKSGWHEVGGCGMVHPNVLKSGGIDPQEFTGFAFGWGIERSYTLRQGLKLDDIRLLYSGELRFLEQF